MGDEAEARRMLRELIDARGSRIISPWGIACLHASLGDVDEAFSWLDVAIDEKAAGLTLVRAHPRLDLLRNDPRYPDLVKRVGLSDFSAASP